MPNVIELSWVHESIAFDMDKIHISCFVVGDELFGTVHWLTARAICWAICGGHQSFVARCRNTFRNIRFLLIEAAVIYVLY